MFTTPFGAILRAHREKLGYTQKKFAQLCGHSESYLSRMETGFSTPSDPNLLDSLAIALSLSEQELQAFVRAARESQKFVQLPARLSLKGYSVFVDLRRNLTHFGRIFARRVDPHLRHNPTSTFR